MLLDAELHALARPVQSLWPRHDDTEWRREHVELRSIERHDEKVSPAGIEARRTSKSAQKYGVDYAHFLRDRRAGDEEARSKYHLGVAMSI